MTTTLDIFKDKIGGLATIVSHYQTASEYIVTITDGENEVKCFLDKKVYPGDEQRYVTKVIHNDMAELALLEGDIPSAKEWLDSIINICCGD